MNKNLFFIPVIALAIIFGIRTAFASYEGTVKVNKRIQLEWQQKLSDAMTWMDAIAYCDNLVLNRKDDWRLPTPNELATLIDYTKVPAIDTNLFEYKVHPSIPDRSFGWSSITAIGNEGRAYVVEYLAGTIGTVYKTENVVFARCVRG